LKKQPQLNVNGCLDPVVSKIIKGDFDQRGINHGRPIYEKPGPKFSVFIYYWDLRDGEGSNGWWFGPKVGGDEVWAYSPEDSDLPPPKGWCVPWDGDLDSAMRLTFVGASRRTTTQEAPLKRKRVVAQASPVPAQPPRSSRRHEVEARNTRHQYDDVDDRRGETAEDLQRHTVGDARHRVVDSEGRRRDVVVDLRRREPDGPRRRTEETRRVEEEHPRRREDEEDDVARRRAEAKRRRDDGMRRWEEAQEARRREEETQVQRRNEDTRRHVEGRRRRDDEHWREQESLRREEEARRCEEETRRREEEEGRRREEEEARRREGEARRQAEAKRKRDEEKHRRDEEEARRREEEDRRRERENQRRQEEKRRREEEKQRREEEKQKRELEARRQAEAERIRKEEEERVREQELHAAASVRRVMQKMRMVNPGSFDPLRTELTQSLTKNMTAMGSLAEKVSQEAEKALVIAKERVEEIKEQRAREERERREAEIKKVEDEKRVAALLKEVLGDVDEVEDKTAGAEKHAKTIPEGPDVTLEAIAKAAGAAEEMAKEALDIAESAVKAWRDRRTRMGDNEFAKAARDDMQDAGDRLWAAQRTLSALSGRLEATRDGADRKAKALKRRTRHQEFFASANGSGSGILTREEVAAFSRSTYDYELTDGNLEAIMTALEPIDVTRFQRMRGMVAIARSEAVARVKRAEEAERKRILDEKRNALQDAMDEAVELLIDAEKSLKKAEDEARKVSRISAEQELLDAADVMDSFRKQAKEEHSRAAEKLKQIEGEGRSDEQIRDVGSQTVTSLLRRHSRIEDQVEKNRVAAQDLRDKAAEKVGAELARSNGADDCGEEATKVTQARCEAVSDRAVAGVTISNNQGSVFLEAVDK